MSPSSLSVVVSMSMNEPHRPRVKYVIGPDGSPLTIADLPAPGTKRGVIRRKAEVVAAVRAGVLSLEALCSGCTLTVDEFLSWQFSIDQHGLAGLRTTRIQQYRQESRSPHRRDEKKSASCREADFFRLLFVARFYAVPLNLR